MSPDIENAIRTLAAEIKHSPAATLQHFKKNQRMDIRRLACIGFLEKGAVSIYRTSDEALTLVSKAPAILGLPQMRSEKRAHYHRYTEDSDVWMIPVTDALTLFEEKKLWLQVVDLLTYLIHEYFALETMTSAKDNTSLVIQHLQKIAYMDESQRKNTSIYTYIMSRCHISRRRIHQILNKLEEENIITVQRGKLISFNVKENT